jgi:fibronectin type 3 domain-containing protein
MGARKVIVWMLLVVCMTHGGCGARPSAPAAGRPRSATLSWDASTSPVRAYQIYRATDPNAQPGLLAVTPGDVTQYVDHTVEPGRTYYYFVKAVGLDGAESELSEPISATIPAN